MDLFDIQRTGSVERYSWEGCVVKVADIADYHKSAIDFFAGMTDQYAIRVFEELIRF